MGTHKGGRPTKLDEEVAKKILFALRTGAYRKVAAAWAGISASTLREWMTQGKRRPNGPFGSFRRSVIDAETSAEILVGRTAFDAAKKDPDYALRYMSIRWRKRWNPSHKVEVTGKGGRDLVPRVDEDALLKKLMAMEALGRGEPTGTG